MIRKFIAGLLSLALLVCALPQVLSADNSSAQSLMASLSIMNGDPDGSFRPDDWVTRAEFTKVAVAASSARNMVASHLAISPFQDVPYTHWSAPYVKVAVENKFIKGYVDSTFRPDNTVLFEEAITVALKLLGYTDDDFGSSWPYGQVGLANNLDLTDNIEKGVGEYLTRADVAMLMYNLMGTRMKDSNTKYITVLDCEMAENVILIATRAQDPSVSGDKIVTSTGTYKLGDGFDTSYIGRRGDLIVKNGDTAISFRPYGQSVSEYTVESIIGADLILSEGSVSVAENFESYYKSSKSTYAGIVDSASAGDRFVIYTSDTGAMEYAFLFAGSQAEDTTTLEKYIVYSTLDDAVVTYQSGALSQISITDGTAAYREGQKSTFGSVKNNLVMGDLLYVKRDINGKISYVSVETGNVTGPVTVAGSSWQTTLGSDASVSVMRDGVKSSLDELQTNDVAYYSEDMHMVFAYSKKVTGIYEKASPNRDQPETVTISGTEYGIESVAAFNALSSSGSFRYGDTITALLGKTGQIADVVSPSSADTLLYGYLTGSSSKEFTNANGDTYTSFYVSVDLPDGTTGEYITSKKYSGSLNSVVSVSFSGGTAKITELAKKNDISGQINASSYKLGKNDLASNVRILDIGTTDKEKTGCSAAIYPQRLDGLTINSSNLLYYTTDSRGDIDLLILNNVTGDMYSYGVVTSADKSGNGMNVSGSYTFDVGGSALSLSSSSSYYNVSIGQGVQLTLEGGRVSELSTLQSIGSVSKIDAASITSGSKTYPLAADVAVYQKTSGYNYMLTPLADVVGQTGISAIAYYDKDPSRGGRVRVIILS